MGRVETSNFGLQYAKEATPGVLPGSPDWKVVEPNDVTQFGATITTVARSPISKYKQRRKGTVTDLDSAVGFDGDLTLEHLRDFGAAFCFSKYKGAPIFTATAVTSGGSGGYTVASGGALAANTLIRAQGFLVPANNGLKVVASGSGSTNIRVDGLTAETPPVNNRVSVCGVRGAAGDLEINSDGNLISTALDFTTLGLTVGQGLWIGGAASLNQFAAPENNGFARIKAIAAHLITLDKRSDDYVTDDGAGQEVDIYFGQFVRNVSVDSPDYETHSFTFEGSYPGLGNPSGTMYEYAKGNFMNQLTLELPITDKGTMSLDFIGLDTQPPTAVRETNGNSALGPLQVGAFNTSADFLRLRVQEVDETGISTYWKSLTLTLNNNVNPEKVLAHLGAMFMNSGNFEVDIQGQLLFTNSEVIRAIRDNRQVTADFALRNEDGAVLFDLPALTFGDGSKEFTRDESVKVNLTGESFGDPTLNTSIGISFFPYLPV